jgi:hypothetical protein
MITENMINLTPESWRTIEFRCDKCNNIILRAKSESPIVLNTFGLTGEVDYVITHKEECVKQK